MIVIGTDTHKRTHTCGAVDAFTAAARGELTPPARRGIFGQLQRWARALDAERVWAIESAAGRVRQRGRERCATGLTLCSLDQHGVSSLTSPGSADNG